ncbi:MAG: phosphoribosyl-ATP diphosphatase [Oscillospiraceae bacterium]|jgi:phosphoribosyl-ATP pyrophosphohydrolase|nr:phosphoribosyl-ATP diphosphatase [Oscillospiraceae bacterium]
MNILNELNATVLQRKGMEYNPEEKSYTAYLFSKGEDKILKKCGEECTEMIIAAKNDDNAELANEVADLLYHILVLCAQKNMPLSDVENVLKSRHNKIGNLKAFKQVDKES